MSEQLPQYGGPPNSGPTVRVRFSSQNSSSSVIVTKASHKARPLACSGAFVMTGPNVAAQALKSLPDTKVLYMSGHAENVIVHRGIVDKGVHFIAKPFTVPEIAKKIRAVLDAAE